MINRGVFGPFLAALLVHAGILVLGAFVLKSSQNKSSSAPKLGSPIDVEMQKGLSNGPGRPKEPRALKKLDPSQTALTSPSHEQTSTHDTIANATSVAPTGNLDTHLAPASLAHYEYDLRKKIEASLKYPTSLRRRGVRGVTLLKLRIPAQGGQGAIEVIQSSGSPELDELAIEAAKAAIPFPSPPSDLLDSQSTLTVHLPIEFKLSP